MATSVPLGNAGMVASWIGFVIHASTTVYCMRAALTHHSRTSRMYHYISIVVTTVASLAYLYMAMAAVRGEAAYWVHFAEWICTTPLLLVDLGMLSKMGMPEIALIMVADVLMIGSGYASEIATDNLGLWGMYAFSCAMFAVIMWSVINHLREVVAHPETNPAENKAFVFLSLWTVTFWTGYVIVWTVIRTGVVGADAGAIIYTLMDINAKDVFGLTIFGLRDVLAGYDTTLATLARTLTGITRPMKLRRSSMDEEAAMTLQRFAAMFPGVMMNNPAFQNPALMQQLQRTVSDASLYDTVGKGSMNDLNGSSFAELGGTTYGAHAAIRPSTFLPPKQPGGGGAGVGLPHAAAHGGPSFPTPPIHTTTVRRSSFREEVPAAESQEATTTTRAQSAANNSNAAAESIMQALRSDPTIADRIRRALEQQVDEEGRD